MYTIVYVLSSKYRLGKYFKISTGGGRNSSCAHLCRCTPVLIVRPMHRSVQEVQNPYLTDHIILVLSSRVFYIHLDVNLNKGVTLSLEQDVLLNT